MNEVKSVKNVKQEVACRMWRCMNAMKHREVKKVRRSEGAAQGGSGQNSFHVTGRNRHWHRTGTCFVIAIAV